MPVRIPRPAGGRRHDHLPHRRVGRAGRRRCCSTAASSAATRRAATSSLSTRPGVPRGRRPGAHDARHRRRSSGSASSWPASTATWTVIAQQTVLTDLRLPNGAVLNYDQWDGYAPARDRLLAPGRASRRGRRAHRRHPPRRRRPAARRRRRVRDDVDLVDRHSCRPTCSRGRRRRSRRRRRRARPPRLHPPHRHAGRRGPPSTAPSTTSPTRRRRCRRGGRSPSTPTARDVVDRRSGASVTSDGRSRSTDMRHGDLAIDCRSDRRRAARRDDRRQPGPDVAAHGDDEALVARHQGIRWTYAEFGERVDRLAPGPARPRPGGRRPGRAVEPELRRVDAAAVRHGRDRRDPRQHQPGLPHPRAGLRAQPVGLPDAVRRPVVQDVGLRRRWSTRSRPSVPGARAGGVLLGGRLGRARRRRRRRQRRRARRPARRRCDPTTRSTSSTRRARPGSRRAPRSPTATSSTTATSSPALQGFTPADRLCIPVPFYHCFGMVMGNLGCTTHGATMVIPSDAFDPTHVLETVAGRAVHRAVRRADDVHRRARPTPTSTATTCRRCAPA